MKEFSCPADISSRCHEKRAGIHAWMTLFRLPNLPTAPGDALAGAAMAAASGGFVARPSSVAAAAASALFLYMYGLADNDIVGIAADRVSAPNRPLPSGDISPGAARAARGVCWGLAFLSGALVPLPPAWWLVSAFLLASICAYNRLKKAWLMGLCRALSVVCGAAAVLPASVSWRDWPIAPIAVMAAGWALYIAAVTKLSEGEERPSEGLGNRRYILGLSALAAAPACFFLPDVRLALLPCAGCLFTFVAWCAAVAPLWRAHEPDERRMAVGRTVGALMYLQVGFMLCMPSPMFLGAACAVWLAVRLVRRLAPDVSGS